MKADASNRQQRIVLLITVGAQDVKLWVRGENGPRIEQIRGKDLRAKHQALLDWREGWAVLTSLQASDPRATGSAPRDEAARLAESLGVEAPVFSSDGRLCLSAAKLEPVTEAIAALPHALQVVGALVFYTERLEKSGGQDTDPRQYATEPIASGVVAGNFLRDYLGLRSDSLAVVNCLEGQAGRYEGALNQPDDFPLRRVIVHRMDSAVRDFIARQQGDFARAVVPVTMTTGGIDAFKQLVPAIAELRFAIGARDLSAPESPDAKVADWQALIDERLCTSKPRLSRHESIAARGSALGLIRSGDPASAWAAVSRFGGSILDQWWLRPLEITAAYFGSAGAGVDIRPGQVQPAPGNSEATERWREAMKEVGLDVQDEFDRHQRFALNAAMRVELALQGRDMQSRRYADALSAVCTMIDAAVIARGLLFVRDDENKNRIESFIEENGFKREDFFLKKKSDVPNSSRDAWFGRRGGKSCSENKALVDALAAHFDALIELDAALGIAMGKEGPTLRSLRNRASHRALSESDIAQIAALGESDKIRLWNPPGPRPIGEHALGALVSTGLASPISKALASIGVSSAADCYRQLMGGLESILLTCEPERAP